ncbi:glycerol-3-phosphate 1-O-acyltransferase PlsY [Legionella fairfieldensis]|uniref:glycerol-3-phosphate 1-O-acyltransferase PlsY n=1 Tax=Legionella fairfieldensis TaxID=45064 RepID=UPI000A06F96A|nr:glycerol-3-phosphate 1-O-acyltransferase PlsY [Legionella fairfieldensis]
MAALLFIFVVVLGYLCGSVCSAVIVSRIFSLPDPRTEGSKNPGATNVLRLAGRKYAVMVLFADLLKGLFPVLLAKVLGAGPIAVSFTCFAAVMGHMYPVFFDFKGGKGVATAIGTLLGLHFILGVVVIATWLLVANFTRYSSLASIVALILAPFYSLITIGHLDTFPPLFFITLFILYKHRDNITRLIDGEEPRIQFTRSTLQTKIDAAIVEEVKDEALVPSDEENLEDIPSDRKKQNKKNH